jgi:hypothetical protein
MKIKKEKKGGNAIGVVGVNVAYSELSLPCQQSIIP